MRFSKFLFLNIFFLLSFGAFSQNTSSLTIKVIDEDSMEIVRSASVALDGPITETQTMETGGAIFTSVPAGTYNVTVKAEGYNDKTGNITIEPTKKKDYSGSFKLQPLKSSKPKTAPANKSVPPQQQQPSAVKLSIKLLDAESGAPLKNAVVEIAAPNKQKKDAVNGMVSFDNVQSGSCAISVTADGYEDKSGKIIIDAKKKSEYSGTLKLIKKKQAAVQSDDSEKLKDIVDDIKEDLVNKTDENKALVKKESAIPAPPPRGGAPEDLSVKKQTAPAVVAAPQEKISAPATAIPQIPEKAWYAPFLKPLMISASIFSSLLLIAFLLGLFIKWSEMTGMVKAVSGIGALGCCTLTFIIIAAAVIICYSAQKDAASISGKADKKAITRFDEVENIFDKKSFSEKTSMNIVMNDAASMHERGKMIFISAMKNNNSEEKEKGLVLLEEAFRAEPGNPLYIMDLADAYVQMSTMLHMKLAQSLYKGLLESAPENDKLLARTADTYARLYQYDKAFQFAARRAWSGRASTVEAASQIALISLVSGDFDRGISELVKIIRSAPPEISELEMILAGLYAENGKKEKAVEILNNLIVSLPENSDLAIRAHGIKRSFVQ